MKLSAEDDREIPHATAARSFDGVTFQTLTLTRGAAMALSTSRSASSSTNGSTAASVPAYSPLEFCEILRACWLDRSEGTLVRVTEEDRKKERKRRRKGKGRADSDDAYDSYPDSPTSSSSLSSSGSSSEAPHSGGKELPTTKTKHFLQGGKSFYVRVNLSASPSCVRHIEQLQNDQQARIQVGKLVSLAQTSSESSCAREDSGNITSTSGSKSPVKRQFRNAKQLLHADARAQTLERRIYLRLLISRTILRYVEKNTGCKYLFKGDRVDHYRHDEHSVQESNAQTNGHSTKKKARCTFWYECASAEYEQPPCAGTMRIVVDLDLGSLLANPKKSTDGKSDEDSSANEAEAAGLPTRNQQTSSTSTLARTPLLRTYGSRSRNAFRYSSIPLSAHSTRPSAGTSFLSSAHPSAVRSQEKQITLPPFVFAIRITHLKQHKETYSVLRATHKQAAASERGKLDAVKRALALLSREIEKMKALQSGGDEAALEVAVEKLWRKTKRLHVPEAFQDDDDEDESFETDEDNGGPEEATAPADNEDGTDEEEEEQVSGQASPEHSEQNEQPVSNVEGEDADEDADVEAEKVARPKKVRPNFSSLRVQPVRDVDEEEEEEEKELLSTQGKSAERELTATPVKKRQRAESVFEPNENEEEEEEYRPTRPKSTKWSRKKGPRSKSSSVGKEKPRSKNSHVKTQVLSAASDSDEASDDEEKEKELPPSFRRYISEKKTSQPPKLPKYKNVMTVPEDDTGRADNEVTDYSEPEHPAVSSVTSRFNSNSSGSSPSRGNSKTPARSSSKTAISGSTSRSASGRTLRSTSNKKA